jgi:hypothetical protein
MVLYDYANRYNQTFVQGSAAPVNDRNDDAQHQEQAARLLRQITQDRKARGITPVRSETRARIARVHVQPDQVTSDLQFDTRFTYQQYHDELQEERSCIERITLQLSDGSWRIIRVEPLAHEHHPDDDFPFVPPATELSGQTSVLPRPLLNTHLLYGTIPGDVQGISRKTPYNRQRAKDYADKYWNSPNPSFQHFDVDCTNYVSQCLLAGGAPMNYTGRRDSGWWYQGRKSNREWWSYSWSVANALQHYLATSRSGLRAAVVQSPYELDLGDVIFYDWDGNGVYQHSTIVTGFDLAGEPLVNAHTVNSRARLWSYRDSPAWSERTRYRFFHIADYF